MREKESEVRVTAENDLLISQIELSSEPEGGRGANRPRATTHSCEFAFISIPDK